MKIDYSKLPAFVCDAEVFSDALTRITTITNYSFTTGSQKQCILVTTDGKLCVYGMADAVTASITLETEVTSGGICCIPEADLLGLLKKRKGNFTFIGKDGNFKFIAENKKYDGYVALKEMTSDAPDLISQIDDHIKGVKLSTDMLDEVKKAIRFATTKHIVFDKALAVQLRCLEGKLRLATCDTYHVVLYESKTDYPKIKDFDLTVTGDAYNAIDKFVANQSVLFAIGRTLQLLKKDSVYAEIPAVQDDTENAEMIDTVSKISKKNVKCDASFRINSDFTKSITNMYALRSSTLDVAPPFIFTLKKKESGSGQLSVSYKTTSGCARESISCTDVSTSCNFTIAAKVMAEILSSFSHCAEFEMRFIDSRFIIIHDNDDYRLIGAGAVDEFK